MKFGQWLGEKNSQSYDLVAVSNHHGSLNSGHYTAICRDANKEWHEFDDSKVRQIKTADWCSDGNRAQSAYVLIYVKQK
jgi:ubiquitin carboxyl-terminal hydrolase 8